MPLMLKSIRKLNEIQCNLKRDEALFYWDVIGYHTYFYGMTNIMFVLLFPGTFILT